MTCLRNATGAAAILFVAFACRTEDRDTIDSAAGAAESSARNALVVISIHLGRHVDAEKKVTEDVDTFAPSDTIYASVHTSGPAGQGSSVVGLWTFPDGSAISQNASAAATSENRIAFFVTRPGGLPAGNYTFQAMIDGRETRAKAARVQ
jgi:hypothetical protein